MEVTCPIIFLCWDFRPLGLCLFSFVGPLSSDPLCYLSLVSSPVSALLSCWAPSPISTLILVSGIRIPDPGLCPSVCRAPWSWLWPSWCWTPCPCFCPSNVQDSFALALPLLGAGPTSHIWLSPVPGFSSPPRLSLGFSLSLRPEPMLS